MPAGSKTPASIVCFGCQLQLEELQRLQLPRNGSRLRLEDKLCKNCRVSPLRIPRSRVVGVEFPDLQANTEFRGLNNVGGGSSLVPWYHKDEGCPQRLGACRLLSWQACPGAVGSPDYYYVNNSKALKEGAGGQTRRCSVIVLRDSGEQAITVAGWFRARWPARNIPASCFDGDQLLLHYSRKFDRFILRRSSQELSEADDGAAVTDGAAADDGAASVGVAVAGSRAAATGGVTAGGGAAAGGGAVAGSGAAAGSGVAAGGGVTGGEVVAVGGAAMGARTSRKRNADAEPAETPNATRPTIDVARAMGAAVTFSDDPAVKMASNDDLQSTIAMLRAELSLRQEAVAQSQEQVCGRGSTHRQHTCLLTKTCPWQGSSSGAVDQAAFRSLSSSEPVHSMSTEDEPAATRSEMEVEEIYALLDQADENLEDGALWAVELGLQRAIEASGGQQVDTRPTPPAILALSVSRGLSLAPL